MAEPLYPKSAEKLLRLRCQFVSRYRQYDLYKPTSEALLDPWFVAGPDQRWYYISSWEMEVGHSYDVPQDLLDHCRVLQKFLS